MEETKVTNPVDNEEAASEPECYPRLRDAIKASKLGRFVVRHKVGFSVGLGTTVAAIATAVAAKRTGFVEVPVVDAATDVIDAVADVAEN